MTMVGYARVSTDHQSLEPQQDALTGIGCERIFTDTLSGARDDRPGLTAVLGYVRAGDRGRHRRGPGWGGHSRRSFAP